MAPKHVVKPVPPLLINYIIGLVKRAEQQHRESANSAWAKWARRFSLGIDQTLASVRKIRELLSADEERRTQNDGDTDEYSDAGATAHVIRMRAVEICRFWAEAQIASSDEDCLAKAELAQSYAESLDALLGD